MGAIYGELLLGREYILPACATSRANTNRLHKQTTTADLLLPMGAFRARARGTHVLHTVHHVARSLALALR